MPKKKASKKAAKKKKTSKKKPGTRGAPMKAEKKNGNKG